MQPDTVPTPAAIASRPHDERGYPVLAITPWRNGVPDFAATSPARILVCAVERRCSICGLSMLRGPYWRVVAADEAVAIAAGPADFANGAPTVEPPGHRLCMLYAAVVCPWLARPNSRRQFDAEGLGLVLARGDSRGATGEIGGAVVAFDDYEFTADQRVEFRFHGVSDERAHLFGTDHLPVLRTGVAEETPPTEECPPWLLADESAAARRAERYR